MYTRSKPDCSQRSFMITLLIAMLLHGILLLQWQFEWQPFSSQFQQDKVQPGLQLILMPPAKAVPKLQRTPSKPATEKPRQQTLKRPAQPPIINDPAPPAPVEQSVAEPETPLDAQAEISQPSAVSSNRLYRDEYIASLLAHIERHKYYPRNARRRGITGKVNIKLQVESDGSISTLETSGAYRVLSLAARQSIESAIPMPHVRQGIDYPVILNFDMRYDIQ